MLDVDFVRYLSLSGFTGNQYVHLDGFVSRSSGYCILFDFMLAAVMITKSKKKCQILYVSNGII